MIALSGFSLLLFKEADEWMNRHEVYSFLIDRRVSWAENFAMPKVISCIYMKVAALVVGFPNFEGHLVLKRYSCNSPVNIFAECTFKVWECELFPMQRSDRM